MANFNAMTFEQRYARIQKYRVTPEDFMNGSAKEGWYIRHYSPNVNNFDGEYDISSGTGFGSYPVKIVGKPYNKKTISFMGENFKIGYEHVVFGKKQHGETYLNDLAMYGQCYHHNTEVIEFFKDLQILEQFYELQAIAIVNGLDQFTNIEDSRDIYRYDYDYDYDDAEFA